MQSSRVFCGEEPVLSEVEGTSDGDWSRARRKPVFRETLSLRRLEAAQPAKWYQTIDLSPFWGMMLVSIPECRTLGQTIFENS